MNCESPSAKNRKGIMTAPFIAVLCCGLPLLFTILGGYSLRSVPRAPLTEIKEQKIVAQGNVAPSFPKQTEPIDATDDKSPIAFAYPPSQRVTLAIGTIPEVDGSLSIATEEGVTIKAYEWKILKAPKTSDYEPEQIITKQAILKFPKPTKRDIGEWLLELTVTDSKNRSSSTEAEIFIHDRIDPFTNPSRIPAAKATLPLDELVVGISVNGESVAYPGSVMDRRAIANDTVGGIPLYVTMCQSCDASAVFKRTLDDGSVISFKSTGGSLIESNYTFPDKETGTKWNVVLGQAVEGPNKGKTLEWLPDEYGFFGTWQQWFNLHPDTLVITD